MTYHDQRLARRMKDPEFRAAYEAAGFELKNPQRCPDCGGRTEVRAGTMLLMGRASLQNLDKLAEVVPEARVPVADGRFRVCLEGCEWFQKLK